MSNLNNELLEYVNHEKPTHDHSSVYYKRFFISKFHYAKSDFKYSDQILTDQRGGLFFKIIKIK